MNKIQRIGIIGGGLSGLALASAASKNGYEILLVEKNSVLASEASGNSLRIIHGGLRYFQTLNFIRIFHSIKAQEDLLTRYSNYISKLKCTLLLPKNLIIPSYALTRAYNLTTRIITGHSNGATIETNLPFELNRRFSHGLSWNDATITDPEGFVNSINNEINGDVFLNTKAISFKDNRTLSTDQGDLEADIWILMGGPLCDLSSKKDYCYGWNLIFETDKTCAIGAKSKGRFLFFVSRKNEIAAGTWYTKDYPSSSQIEEAKQEISSLIPELELKRFIKAEVGVLPGITPTDKIETIKHSTHIEVITPKLTTCFHQARLVLESIRG